MMSKSKWKVGEAKQRFSEVVRDAGTEPQLIFNREELAAAVVSAEEYREFEEWRAERRMKPLGELFLEAREILAEERYTLRTPSRKDRRNALVDALD